ncbi:nucleotidyl transferase AbiEii/AbiGii toxin family protein [Erysipelothrix rhusiopathiae]|uniref:nucleotidyl transferase AbiEii/AbiGii toxin family protein n=1 Tax=Erysipelothrix rhusiopathiae TaxID=1648 RepID=UPI0023AF641E|nr:nucleotidyl transferase AbiEii/AbiGii toxin family protein [Erysipelothrix rhusiopathiae]MDE8071674.1 nucleotidyl transferase AbiEii/AbiGii toxin family protein [Erysipelothrix rhusiopathiae]MDE8119506.1 nucleotidyl transferase AbiEii/AbiGii toxin family protein [Erysipelothrix rhusiopathiae]MDE8132273.1 nucleotidyl transferase AbiEii/AbiGii toxin family protein [Erysipelothrix rhusiopathiae]MDE8148421.1 nucleotidyl transferase AbiEii/AbiGii toxin family protein [Erysipelothrix rhusiopathiae
MRTSEQLKGYLRNLAKEKNISAQELLQIFMFERLIERLSLSEYRNHIVLKGGLLVASLIGIDERTTMDMDTTIVGYPVTEESMETLIEDIIKVELDDGIQFEFLGLNPIRKNDDYSNYTIKLEATYQEIRVPLKIDVTTGDAITPREIAYDYYLSFEGKTVSIYSYPIETVLAEKLETILSRNVTNTRARDFYDIYLLYNTQWEKVDISDLKEALIATGTNRDSLDEIDAYSEIMEDISTSRTIITSWERYQSENAYAREIELKNILIVISNILELLNLDDK